MNRPYGGFPWITLPPVLYDTFANAHNGYGDFVDLESATLEDAQQFFDRYYAPGNAVLTVAGDVDPAEVLRDGRAALRRHPGARGARAPELRRAARPRASSARSSTTASRPTPAVAMAWRVPDPADLDAYLPYVVLAEVLTDGDAARLNERLVLRDRSVTSVGGYLGVMGDPLDARDPTPLLVEVHHPSEVPVDTVLVGRRRGGRPAGPATASPTASCGAPSPG